MNAIDKYLELANKHKEKTTIVMVTNVDGVTTNFDDYGSDSLISEYLSELELEELETGFRSFGFRTKIHYDETDFIKQISGGTHSILNTSEAGIVLSMAQKGKKVGRKSLLPAFCDLYNLNYTSSNPYTVSLCRNKYHSGLLLKNHEIKVPESWLYTKEGWLFEKRPPQGYKVIIKLNNESASIGIDETKIIKYEDKYDSMIHEMCLEYQQDLILQQFIEGYEIEHPIMLGNDETPLVPIGIQVNDQKFLADKILTYEIRGKDQYSFYNYNLQNKEISQKLIETTSKAAKILGITGFGRIDYRIDLENNYFVTDIATNPHIVRHSSFHQSFKELGYTYDQMLATLIGTVLDL